MISPPNALGHIGAPSVFPAQLTITSVGVYTTDIPSLGRGSFPTLISDVPVFNARWVSATLRNRLRSAGIFAGFSKIRQIISATVSGMTFLKRLHGFSYSTVPSGARIRCKGLISG